MNAGRDFQEHTVSNCLLYPPLFCNNDKGSSDQIKYVQSLDETCYTESQLKTGIFWTSYKSWEEVQLLWKE